MIIKTIDERIAPDGENLGEVQAFVEVLASKLYDKSFGLTKQLYDKVMEIDLAESSKGHGQKIMSDKLYNYFIWSAANFKETEFLATLMMQSTILDYKIDVQTYIKSQLCLYFLLDEESTNNVFFQNHCKKQVDFDFGSDLVKEYIQ